MNPPMKKPDHWMVRMNYRNRTVCFALLFATLGAHMVHRGFGPLAWGLLALQFLVYPHLLYWHAHRSADQRRAELINMVLDVVVFGIWAAAMEFALWITFILCVGATVNLTAFRGPKGFFQALGIMALGAAAHVAAMGLHVSPATDWPTTLLSILSVSYFQLVVASGAHSRAIQLHKARDNLRASEQALQAANGTLTRQLEEINVLQVKLSEQANRDPLTGLYNRRYLDSTMEREVARCKREGLSLSLMLIDIDHFKRINDTYGHQAGDEVLKHLAVMLADQARAGDVACRYGGEEFLLLLPGMPHVVALDRGEALRNAFDAATVAFGDFRIRATLSIGIATYPGHGISPQELIGGADQALYRAKTEGRNRVVGCESGATALVA